MRSQTRSSLRERTCKSSAALFGRVHGAENWNVRQRGFIFPSDALHTPLTLYTSPGVMSSSVHYTLTAHPSPTQMSLSFSALHSYSSMIRVFKTV